MKKILLLVVVTFIIGCTTEAEEQAAKAWRLKQQQSTDACLKQGGVPIYSTLDNRLKDCKFK
jgi:hypothetical protein